MKVEKSIQSGNAVIGYSVEGAGFPIVFVHGFPMDHTAWDDFVKPLAEKYRVILADNAGFGKSSLPEQDLSMDYYSDGLKAILDEEKITSCVMLGHSMGGYIVLNFAQRFPGYLKGYGLLHSTSYADDEAKKKNRIEVAEAARKSDGASFVSGMLHKLFGEQYSSFHEKEIAAMKVRFGTAATAEGIAQASLAMGKRQDTTGVLNDAKVPVLFIIGKDDKVIPPEKTLPLTHLPECSVIGILNGTGHMGMIESPDESRKKIIEWMELCTQAS
ncbi:MAG: alpha/beta hydrolase [Chitinophagales bacterium]